MKKTKAKRAAARAEILFTPSELDAVLRLVNVEVQHGNEGPDAAPEAKADAEALRTALVKLMDVASVEAPAAPLSRGREGKGR